MDNWPTDSEQDAPSVSMGDSYSYDRRLGPRGLHAFPLGAHRAAPRYCPDRSPMCLRLAVMSGSPRHGMTRPSAGMRGRTSKLMAIAGRSI